MFTRIEGTLVSLPVLRDRYRANNVELLNNVQNKMVLPTVIRKFEAFFDENAYIYTRPMTDVEFRQFSNDPIQVEQYKTAYTNHYLEYQKHISQYETIDTTIKEFVEANKMIGKFFWRAVFNTCVIITAAIVLVSMLFS